MAYIAVDENSIGVAKIQNIFVKLSLLIFFAYFFVFDLCFFVLFFVCYCSLLLLKALVKSIGKLVANAFNIDSDICNYIKLTKELRATTFAIAICGAILDKLTIY